MKILCLYANECALELFQWLKEQGHACTLVNARFAKPFDAEMIRRLSGNHGLIVTMEENVASGGLGEKVRALADEERLPVRILSIHIPDEYVEHGNVEILKREIGIDEESILEKIGRELA